MEDFFDIYTKLMYNNMGYSRSFNSFDDEDKVGVGRDWTDSSASVCGIRWADNSDFLVDIKVNTNLIPTFNNLTSTDSQGEWLSSIVA